MNVGKKLLKKNCIIWKHIDAIETENVIHTNFNNLFLVRGCKVTDVFNFCDFPNRSILKQVYTKNISNKTIFTVISDHKSVAYEISNLYNSVTVW